MKKLLLIVLLAGLAFSTQARKVMFRVDMTGHTVGANGVHMPGNFKDVNYDGVDENPGLTNWDAASNALTDPDADGIYTVVLDLAPNLVYEYKFINGNDWPQAENVPGLSQVGGGNQNRWIFAKGTSGTDTLILAAVKFQENAPAGMKAIRFRVNMAKVVAVSPNGVHVAGDFQGWNPSRTQLINYAGNGAFSGTIYEYIGYVANGASGGAAEYKFVNDNDWPGAENVPSGCVSNGNRTLGTVSTDSLLAIVCFGSCDNCPAAPIPVYDVTFRVDMTYACAYDSVDIAGPQLNNWAGGTMLKPESVGSKIYTVTAALDSGEIEYKFRKLIAGSPSWEGLANRKVNISSDTILALVCYDSDAPCVPIPDPSIITFIADLSNEIPDPNGDIFVIGNFTQPNWQAGAIKLLPVPNQIGVYSASAEICQGTFAYKFVNGPTSNTANEESFPSANDRGCVIDNGNGGFNRTYTRTTANATTLGYVFNSCTTLNVGIENSKLLANTIGMFPNPSSESTTITFDDESSKHSVRITDLTGRLIAEYNSITENTFNVNTQNINAGVYLVSIQNDRNETASLKLMVR